MKHTVEGWRRIGRAYERLATGDISEAMKTPYVRAGLCKAAESLGFPSYDSRGSVRLMDSNHGNTLFDCWAGDFREQAAHRALSAYLIAEMFQTGDLPLCR